MKILDLLGVGLAPDRPIVVDTSLNPLAATEASILVQGNANKERIEIKAAGTSTPVFGSYLAANTIASPQATPTGQNILVLGAGGHSGSAWVANKGVIKVTTTELWSGSAQGNAIIFETTTTGTTTRSERLRIGGGPHVGIAQFGAQMANAHLYIGSGTGTLNDASISGITVKVDSTGSSNPSAGRFNLNLIASTPTGAMQGIVCRVDVADTLGSHVGSAADTVAVWGECSVTSNSARNAWGLHSYVAIEPSATAYTGTAVGCELGVYNKVTGSTHAGGILHLTTGPDPSTYGTIRFGLLIDGKCDHSLMIHNDANGPITNLLYIGALTTGSVPTGVPDFVIKETGKVGIKTTAPTAMLHLPAGTAAANTGALKLTEGVAPSVDEDGLFAYDTDHLWFTIGSTRFQLDQQSGSTFDYGKSYAIAKNMAMM